MFIFSLLMYMLSLFTLLVVVLMLWTLTLGPTSQDGGAPADPQLKGLSGTAPFSGLDNHIGDGVHASYDNILNGEPEHTKRITNPLTPIGTLLPTYQGHSLPLTPVGNTTLWGPPITPHHLNVKCAPECCPSPYSCDHGCLCIDQDGLRKGAFGSL